MAEGQALTEELASIKIHTGICGVVFFIVGTKLVACGLAAFILHEFTFQFTMSTMALSIAGFGIGLWALFSGVCYSALSYKGKGNEKQLYLRMVAHQLQWTLFTVLIHIATIVFLAVFLNTANDANQRVRAITITCIVGCGISAVFTFIGGCSLAKCIGTLGMPAEQPRKPFILTAFKTHGCVILIIAVHQIVWALVALIVPELGGRRHRIRIAAFSVGGFVNPILAIITATVCFKVVKYVNKPTENKRVMTKTIIDVHKAWIWAFIGINIAGTALYGVCFGTLQEEHGNWTVTAPCYVVVGHILSLVGNILIGYLYFAVAHYEQFQQQLGICTTIKPTNVQPVTSRTTGNGNGGATAKKAATKPADKPAVKPAAKPADKTADKTAAKSTATRTKKLTKRKTKGKDTEATDSSSNENEPTSSGATGGATGTSNGASDINELKERNRLLQEEVALQKQLNELRLQQLQAPSQSVLYTGNNVQIGPNDPSGLPPIYTVAGPHLAPPSYDDVTSYSEKPT